MEKEATPVQARIQKTVTNGRGYDSVSLGRGSELTADSLRTHLMLMDMFYPRSKFYEPSKEKPRDDFESEPARKRSSGLVPIGFTAARIGNGRTLYQANDGGSYFIN